MSLARRLFLAAYDIRSSRRLRRALHVLKNYACGGQKSVFECWLSPEEEQSLLRQVVEVMDSNEDRFLLVPLLTQKPVFTLGIAEAPRDEQFFYVG